MAQKYYDEHGNEVNIDEVKPRQKGGCLKMALAIIGVIVLMVIIGVAFTDVDTESDELETSELTTVEEVEAEEESNGTITSVEEVEEENIDVGAPLVTIEELPYNIEIQQPNSIGSVYGVATYTNESEYPLGSFRLTVNLKDQNEKTYYSTHDAVMPGETSPNFDSFAPETLNPEDIEVLVIKYRVVLEDGSEQSVEYNVKLDQYRTLHIEDPL